jgi:hypothetical protein
MIVPYHLCRVNAQEGDELGGAHFAQFWYSVTTLESTLIEMSASVDSKPLTKMLKSFRCNTYKKQGEANQRSQPYRNDRICGDLYALANSFSSALPLRNHGRSRLCMYRGKVRFFASSFRSHSRASSRRFADFRKLA